jgi:hypothetical protein
MKDYWAQTPVDAANERAALRTSGGATPSRSPPFSSSETLGRPRCSETLAYALSPRGPGPQDLVSSGVFLRSSGLPSPGRLLALASHLHPETSAGPPPLFLLQIPGPRPSHQELLDSANPLGNRRGAASKRPPIAQQVSHYSA